MKTRAEVAIDVEAEEEETLYDERLAVRRLTFRNTWHHPLRVMLPLDQSAESLTSAGAPSWLVGSVFMLTPSVFDIHYWHSEFGFSGINTRRERRPIGRVDDCLRMIVHLEFLDNGQVQFRSQLLAEHALEEWQRAQGDPERLNTQRIITKLGDARRRRWFETHPQKDRFHPESVVIQETITVSFPMGPYRGTDNRLILHQNGLDRIHLIEPTGLLPRQHIAYTDLNILFKGNPCASPRMDPRTGELINVLCELKDNPAKYHVISLSQSMDTFQNIPHVGNVVATFLAPPTKLEHFAISERFVIVVIHSNRYSKRMPNYASSIVDGVDSLLKFDEKADTLFYVISRSARQLVAVYRSEPSHVTAVVNAFEGDSDTIYIDVVAGDSLSSNDRLVEIRVTELEELKHQLPPSSTLRRYCLFRLGEEIARFDGAAGQLPSFPLALFHHLTDYSLSSPVISPSFVGTPYRHAFGLTIDRDNRGKPGFLPNAIVKCDLSTPIRSKQWHRTGCYASAPLFIPRAELAYPASTARTEDDDGVIVTAVLDVFSQKSFLVVLDARDLRELARYTLPKSIPITPSTPVWCPNRASLALPPAFVEVPEKTALLPRE